MYNYFIKRLLGVSFRHIPVVLNTKPLIAKHIYKNKLIPSVFNQLKEKTTVRDSLCTGVIVQLRDAARCFKVNSLVVSSMFAGVSKSRPGCCGDMEDVWARSVAQVNGDVSKSAAETTIVVFCSPQQQHLLTRQLK